MKKMLNDLKLAITPFYLPLPLFLLSRWLLLMCLWLLTQGVFLIVNYDLFVQASLWETCRLVFESFRYAISGTLFILSPFLVLKLLPLHYKHNRYYQGFADFWYYVAALLFFIANGVDIAYYPITHQRMNFGIFRFLDGVKDDFIRLLPTFFVQYWYLTILAILGIFILFFVGTRLKLASPEKVNGRYYIKQILCFLIFIPLIILGQRGGLQPYPLNIFQIMQHTTNNAGLVLNTPFIIMKTIGKPNVEDVRYYTDEDEMSAEFTPYRHYTDKIFSGDNLPNIIIIVLEGFATEYSKYLTGGNVGYMPFIDSLAQQGIVYRGMSNSKHSIVGIPAVIAGFPNWLQEDYILSPYLQNEIPSLANTLKTMNYTSSFYHGATNGTMGFDAFVNKIGFDEYLGQNEYNNDDDYDGDWGIFDEPYMQYVANRLPTHTTQPFLSVIFTVTSHGPWVIPEKYKGHFPKGTLVSHETVGYTDYAVQRFFETARTKPWFENTLFIITADHTALLENDYYTSSPGSMEIPAIWYFPKHIKPKREQKIMSQIDIMPSVLHYVGYDKPFIAFGESVFDTTVTPYSMRFYGNDYQLVEKGYVLNFMDGQSISLKKDDKNFTKSENLISSEPEILQNMERRLKAMIQQYNSRVIHNKFVE